MVLIMTPILRHHISFNCSWNYKGGKRNLEQPPQKSCRAQVGKLDPFVRVQVLFRPRNFRMWKENCKTNLPSYSVVYLLSNTFLKNITEIVHQARLQYSCFVCLWEKLLLGKFCLFKWCCLFFEKLSSISKPTPKWSCCWVYLSYLLILHHYIWIIIYHQKKKFQRWLENIFWK